MKSLPQENYEFLCNRKFELPNVSFPIYAQYHSKVQAMADFCAMKHFLDDPEKICRRLVDDLVDGLVDGDGISRHDGLMKPRMKKRCIDLSNVIHYNSQDLKNLKRGRPLTPVEKEEEFSKG